MIGALERLEVSAATAGEPGRVAVLDLLRARTRRFDVRVRARARGGLAAAPGPQLAVPRRRPPARARRAARAAGPGQPRPLPLLHRLHARDAAARSSSARRRPTTARRRSRARSGTTSRRSSTRRTWRARRAGARSRSSRCRSTRRRPSASGCGRSRALSAEADSPDLAAALAEANGWTRRLAARGSRSTGRRACATRRCSRRSRRARRSARPSSSASSTARRPGSSSALVDPKTIDAEADALLRGKVAHQALYAFYNGLPKELGAERVTEANLDAALVVPRALPRRRAAAAACGSSWARSTRPSCARGCGATSSGSCATRRARELALVPRRFEVGFGTDRSAPELQRGLELGDGLFVSGKIDRIDVDPLSARGIVQDYKSGKGSFSARQIDDERRLQVPLYMLVLRDLVGIEPLGGVYRALSGARGAARHAPRRGARRPAGLQRERLPRRGRVRGPGRDRARAGARGGASGSAAATSRTTRRAASARRGATSGRCAGWRGRDERAADRGGRRARRGVRLGRRRHRQDDRARRALRARGLRRGARRRVGARDHVHAQGGRRSCARASARRCSSADATTSRAGSTAPGSRPSTASARACCVRTRSRSGIDPRFRELDEQHGAVIRGEAFDRALAAFCATGAPDRLRLLATYGAARLRRMLTGVYETLRSAGRPLVLVPDEAPDLARWLRELREAAECLAADADATAAQRDAARAAIDLPADAGAAARSRARCGRRASRAATYEEARKRVEQAALELGAGRDRELLQELLDLFAAEYARRQGARVGARLRGPPAPRARPARGRRARPRGRAAPLPRRSWSTSSRTRTRCSASSIDLLAGGRGERGLLRRRRVPVDLRLPARRRRGLPASGARRRRSGCR